MSLNDARVLGEDEWFGSIEPGKLADLVVIDGDPVRRDAEICNLTLVFKEGVGYDAPALAESMGGDSSGCGDSASSGASARLVASGESTTGCRQSTQHSTTRT